MFTLALIVQISMTVTVSLLYLIVLSVSQFQVVYVVFHINCFIMILFPLSPHICTTLLFFKVYSMITYLTGIVFNKIYQEIRFKKISPI